MSTTDNESTTRTMEYPSPRGRKVTREDRIRDDYKQRYQRLNKEHGIIIPQDIDTMNVYKLVNDYCVVMEYLEEKERKKTYFSVIKLLDAVIASSCKESSGEYNPQSITEQIIRNRLHSL